MDYLVWPSSMRIRHIHTLCEMTSGTRSDNCGIFHSQLTENCSFFCPITSLAYVLRIFIISHNSRHLFWGGKSHTTNE